ncbi:hypothetical protein BJ138DRAFT_181955 [Hygrophoropsis aurantiaca]|uniref:Uncharacterized protein n=1 Tax=Hygrophoropsis aurantiaca TaxID=72124 RepID=A0ACB7ZQ81_9AGAM|nr:hypothetical protein BJ138DRAFT_181955 [Hygrophoropsis aurantiaca]
MDSGMDCSESSPFRCTCLREFRQESAFTRHQHTCTKGKKRLFSALSKAKNLLSSAKRLRLDNASQIYLQPGEHSSSFVTASADTGTSRGHTPPTRMNPPNSSISTDSSVDVDLPLAQCRPRRSGVKMPLRYRQYDDVLPQPPPTVPPHVSPSPESHSLPSTSHSDCAPQFRTPPNIFGLLREFSASSPPSHDPESSVTLEALSLIPDPKSFAIEADNIDPDHVFHPYPNRSSFELGNWYWNGGVQKSRQSFKDLVEIIGGAHFDLADIRNTPWDSINSRLGTTDEEDEWEDVDAGWRKTQVSIEVPFSRTTSQPGVQSYLAAQLYHRSLVEVIKEKLANATDNGQFHYEPYQLRWKAPHLPDEVNIHGELYTSPAFMDSHRALQDSPREPDCNLERVVVALMFWSDATHLTSFGET